MTDVHLAESVPLVEAASGTPRKRRFRARLIEGNVQGSSGYYSADILRRDGPQIFTKGLPVFLDHPSVSERVERPERSVRDLAGRLATGAVYEGDGLYADIEVYPHFAPIIEAMAADIGMSIRASGTVEGSTDERIRGPIVTSLAAAASVDFVTAAGAGGKIVGLLESARAELGEARNVGAWLESRLHLAFTQLTDDMYGEGRLSRDERIGLSSAIGDALSAFVARCEADHPQLYERDLWDGPPEDTAQMAETTTRVPASPAKPLEVTRVSGPQTGAPNGGPADLSEADRLRAELAETKRDLSEAQLKLAQRDDNDRELEETKRELAEAKRENLKLRANDAARAKATATLATSTLPKVAHAEVVEAVTGDNVPLNDDGALDEAKLVEAIKAAIERERRYLARFAEEAGIGTVRGLGSSGDPNEMSEADLHGGLKEIFGRLGMSEQVADLAARGR